MNIPNIGIPAGSLLRLPGGQPRPQAAKPSTSLAESGTAEARSGLAAFAMSYSLTELTYSAQETQFAFRKDQSLALRAQSSTDLHLKQEHYRFELTFSAEQLGLTAANFANPGQPITMQFTYQQSQMQIEHTLSANLVKTTRSPEEVITDIAKMLSKVLRDPGNKSVRYELDEEARQALLGADPKLWEELVAIMAMINLQKRQGEASKDYVIAVSGKGKPYLDLQEKTKVEGAQTNIQIQIKILPPAAENSQAPASSSPESAQ